MKPDNGHVDEMPNTLLRAVIYSAALYQEFCLCIVVGLRESSLGGCFNKCTVRSIV